QSSMCSYDSSVEEIWLAFATGATLVLMDDDAVRLGPDLVDWLARERVTVFCPPPTLLRMAACDDPQRALPELKLVYVGGEELPLDVAARWAPGRRLENGYGPTECSVTVVRTPVRAGEPVRIGWPVEGNTAYVLDSELRELPPGTPGELCIAGLSVTRGYLHQPQLTAERFVEHPRFGRLYRTGDLVDRAADGALIYLGRSDSQVKIRGHRVELSAIEAHLCECLGVRAAACALQGTAPAQELSAFLVSDGGALDLEYVREHMRSRVPDHMQPLHYAAVDGLPTRDASGKLDRSALPDIRTMARPRPATPAHAAVHARDASPLERLVWSAFAEFLPHAGDITPAADFFLDLGGNSLLAAQVISRLRKHPETAGLTVRDVYDARTATRLASIAASRAAQPEALDGPARDAGPMRGAFSAGALAQLGWIVATLPVTGAVTWWVVFAALPALDRAIGSVPLLLALPAFAFAFELAWLPVGLGLTWLAKRVLIGRYTAAEHDHLSSFHVRHWIVVSLAHLVPWSLVRGTPMFATCLRVLGARIGADVHVHRGVDLTGGGWDLLDIGDGATLGRDVSVGVVEWRARRLVLAPVTIGRGATLDTRVHVGGGASVGHDAFVGALSSVPDGATVPPGARYAGVPAVRTGDAPPAPVAASGAWSVPAHAAALLGARLVAAWLPLLPGLAIAAALLRPGAPGTGLLPAPLSGLPVALAPLALVLGYALSLPAEALLVRLFGRITPGAHPLRGPVGIALAMKDQAIETANAAISGTLLWPTWLRMAGARIGAKCEISTVMEVVPELLEVGDECFFADGIYLGRPLLHRGHAVCGTTRLSTNTFLGNHVVIPAGAQMPRQVLLGICTVAEPERMVEGTSWFGNPALELPRREVTDSERELTHDPGFARFATRVVFESARAVLPLVPLALGWAWFLWAREQSPSPTFFAFAIPATFATIGGVLLAAVLVVKWGVMGPIRESRHALWSCWCCRWDVLFEVWAGWAVPVLLAFEGTPFVAWWLRAMGCSVGHGVVFGSSFLQVVDPEMLVIEDGATVSCHLQSHSFEDRVLKLAPVRIGAHSDVARGAVLLYGADVGERTEVTANGVVMKREQLLPGLRYEGCPTRATGRA
ncbi:MAG: AMP-binding protein, partial [Candidatus Eisenbacteria bacterium]